MRGEAFLQRVSPRELLGSFHNAEGAERAPTMDDFLSVGHGIECAMTDTGKTNDIRYLAVHTRLLAVVWNPEDERMPGVRVRAPEDLHKAIATGQRKVNYVPPEDDDERRTHMAACLSVLSAIGDAMRAARDGEAAPVWCVFLVDEVQDMADNKTDKTPEKALTRALKKIRKRGVRIWMFTQEPAEVPTVCLSQTQVFMLKEVKAARVEYLEGHAIPMSAVWRHVQKPYHFAVVIKNRYALCTPLPYVPPQTVVVTKFEA